MTIEEVVLLFDAKRVGGGWMARCPAHQDTNPSLSISEGQDGRVLVKCQAGCPTEAVLAATGLKFADLFQDSPGEGVRLTLVHSNTRTVGLTLEEYAAGKRLPVDFLRTLGLRTITWSGIKAVRIPYFDASGREVAAQLRLALAGHDRFRWTKGSKPQPYGQQRLSDAKSAGQVTLVEGPSDSETLWFHSIPALGLPSASTWKADWAELLEGIETIYVVVEPDAGGQAVLSWLNKVSFRSRVKLLRFEGATVLGTMLKTAVAWGVIDRMPCVIKLLRVPKSSFSFYDFDEFERVLVAAEKEGETALLVALLGGHAGLRCGEMMALERPDIDWEKLQLTVERSEWKGHVTAPKGGRIRHLRLTERLGGALRKARHLRGPRVLCDQEGQPLTQKVVQGIMRRVANRAKVKAGVHILRHTFCSHLAMRGAPAKAIQELAGHQHLSTTMRYMHLSPAALDSAIRLLDEPKLTGVVEK